MTRDFDAQGLPLDLLDWIETTSGGEIAACERIAGGASRLSYILRLTPSSPMPSVFLRVDSGSGGLSGTEFTLEREVNVIRSLGATGVRAPDIYGYNATHRAVLMQVVPGDSNFFSIKDAAREKAIEDDLLRQLALLHKARVDLKSAFGANTSATIKGALQHEVKLWGDLYRSHVASPDPVLSFALDWLRRSAPGGDTPPVVVHGDIGPGNFLFEAESVGALIDWEIAHAGHPLEDIACIIARTLGVPFGDLKQHVATYGELTGAPVDYDELDYCLVLVLVRFCVGISMGIARAGIDVDLPMLVKFLQVNLFALIKIMARLSGVRGLDSMPAAASASATRPLYDFMSDSLTAQFKPAITEPYLLARLDGMAGLNTYLRNLADYGTDRLRAEELAALRNVLGREVESIQDGRLALPDALEKASDEKRAEMLPWLLKRSALEHVLMKDMLGPMYDRALSY